MDRDFLMWLLGGGFTVIGLLLARKDDQLGKEMDKMNQRIDEATGKFHKFESAVLVGYIPRSEVEGKLERLETALFTKLDRIESKIDSKADKN